MSKRTLIPVIDLFAGPAGLGEGFSSYPLDGVPKFRIGISIEKETCAHRTLLLRSFYRQFPRGQALDDYYQHLRGNLSYDELFERYAQESEQAREEARVIVVKLPALVYD